MSENYRPIFKGGDEIMSVGILRIKMEQYLLDKQSTSRLDHLLQVYRQTISTVALNNPAALFKHKVFNVKNGRVGIIMGGKKGSINGQTVFFIHWDHEKNAESVAGIELTTKYMLDSIINERQPGK